MEIVEKFRTEKTIPEWKTILPLLFERKEIKDLTYARRNFENKLRSSPRLKEDCMRYIEFEDKLMKEIGIRLKKKGLKKNAKIVNLSKHLNKLIINTIRSFPSDLRLWMFYIRFCKQMRFIPAMRRILQQMLHLHGKAQPELFKIAANVELNECNNVEKARQHLFDGIRIHKDNKVLLTEAFKVELNDTDKQRKQCSQNKIVIDQRNLILTSKKAEIIYEHLIKKLNDLELMNKLLSICAEFDFTNQLEGKIESDMQTHIANERMWDIFARRELNSDKNISLKTKITKCISFYEKGLDTLNTPRMWALYIDTLHEINEDREVLPKYKRKLLMSALHKGGTSGKLSEKHYLLWVDRLKGGKNHKKIVEVLQGAVKWLPKSAVLWVALMQEHVSCGEDKAVEHVFNAGANALGSHSLPLWNLMLVHAQAKTNRKVQEIYNKSWSQYPEISNVLRPMHLEWLVQTAGIADARKTYDKMCDKKLPLCMAIHKKMIYLETIQPTMRKQRIAQCHTIACAQFGDKNVDVWIDFYKFVFNNGANEKEIQLIYDTACKYLVPSLRDEFLFKFKLYKVILMGTK